MAGRVERTRPDPAGFDALFRDRYPEMARLAGWLVGDFGAGEEMAQEAFARLLDRWDRTESPPAYLRTILVNLCRAHVRRAIVVRRHPPEPPQPAAGPEAGTEAMGERDALRLALRRLPRRQREAVVLRYYGDLSLAEVAEAMAITTGAVKAHLHRALAALSDRLEGLR